MTTNTTTKRALTPEERRIIRKYDRAYKRILGMFSVAIIVAIALTAIITSSLMSRPYLVQVDEQTYFVEEGDTLWNYAENNCPDDMDIRKYIQIIIDYNDKDSANIEVGEIIYLPIFDSITY